MRREFVQVISIELQPELARHAKRRFGPYDNVTIIQGDSAHILQHVVEDLRLPALFWLDGHASGGNTAATEPLSAELRAVMKGPTGSVVLIDDARTFTGGSRMTLPEIRDVTAPRYAMDVADDVIRLTEKFTFHARDELGQP